MPSATPNFNLKLSILSRKTLWLVLLAAIILPVVFVLYPGLTFAQTGIDTTIQSKGIVQCTGPNNSCTLCNLYEGTRRLINFLLWYLALPLTVAAVAGSGIMFLLSGGSENLRAQAKNALSYAVWGMLLAFGAWVIVNTILTTLGYKGNWTDYGICQQFDALVAASPSPAPAPPPPPPAPLTLPGGTRSHAGAVEFLKGAGINVVSSSGCLGKNELGCTTLEGIPSEALAKIYKAKQDCDRALPKCDFVISAGTETVGHGATTEHGPGKGTVDIQTKDAKTYMILKTLFLNRINQGGLVQCEAKGNEKGINCNGSEGPANHLHVSGL
ncbi:MAG: pilin [bacterium]|nr:pilin [bacterium]